MYKLELYLLRHGKTICNEKKLYCGTSDINLSENGKNELLEFKILSDFNIENEEKLDKENKVTSSFKYPKCQKNYTSGAKRANETFEILYPENEYEIIKGFWEYNFGDFEMKSYDILKENKSYINWIMDIEGNVSDFNGESKVEYKNRISKTFKIFLNSCLIEKIKSALVVSHGGTIGTILELFYSNEKSFYEWQPKCGLGYKLVVEYNADLTKIIINKVSKIDNKM